MMLKYIRYILSTRRAAKKYQQHTERLHMMSADDVIGIALWYCEDWLEYRNTFTLEDRLSLKIRHKAPNAGAVLDAVQSVYDVVINEDERYIKMLPAWCDNQPNIKVADRWLVDEGGYFVKLEDVVKQLHEQLSAIHSAVNDPQNEDYKYHYTKKPKAVYESVTDLLNHFH